MTRNIAKFDLLGVNIRIDASWVLLALLIAWSLAAGTFPEVYRGLPAFAYWGMAAATVLGVAASIILHELGHSLVARAFGLPISSITLFVFGGVAAMEGEPKAPRAELLMALAGPLVSVFLGFGFLAVADLIAHSSPTAIFGVLHYLGVLNLALAAFNMAPAFPLDGGRVLRALIWMLTGDALKATRAAARSGEIIGLAMIALGALATLQQGFGGGLWWAIMGWFIFSMARAHRDEAMARSLLSGALVGDLMTPHPVTAPSAMSVAEFVDAVLARFPHDLIPVVSDGHVLGGAGFSEVRQIPRATWRDIRLAEIATPLARIPTAGPGDAIETALKRLQQAQASRLLVMDGGALVGVLTLKDLAAHLRFRAEFRAPHSGAPYKRAPIPDGL